MRLVVARPCMLLALLGAGALLAACGSTSRQPVTSSAKVASSATGPARTQPPLAPTRATAYAHALNLTAADVPGFALAARHGEHESPAERHLEHETARCTGGAGFNHGLAEASSEEFERKGRTGAQSVSSSVTVLPTSAVAVKELMALRSGHVRSCVAHYLGLLFRGQRYEGATIGPISIESGTPPAFGTAGGFAWRVHTTIVGHGIATPYYMDTLGFVNGPAVVALLTYGFPRPFPARIEQGLFSLLAQRAKARRP
jgi:hypothetical protein